MLITKFNRMIRSKVLWSAFAIMVSLSFLGYFGPGSCTPDDQSQRSDIQGTLFGEEVSRRDFTMARTFEMGMRERADMTPELAERIHHRTWKRLAALHMADAMGLTASLDDTAETIRQDPSFSDNGAFSRQRYQAAVESQLRVDVGTFESYLREELTIRNLLHAVGAILPAPPQEVSSRLANMTDLFTVEYAVIPTNIPTPTVTVDEAAAKDFYAENEALFRESAQVRVRYVAFPVSNFVATSQIPESDLREYYDDNDEEFAAEGTNSPGRLPFEEVKDRIASKLQFEAARFKARDAATEFVLTLVPDRAGKAMSLVDSASHMHLAVSTSEYFTLTGTVPGLDVDTDFNRAAFDLDPADPSRAFTDAVTGMDAVYVLAFHDRIDARIPAFEEVKDRATALARRAAQEDAFRKKSQEIRAAAVSGVRAGKSFANSLSPYPLTVTTSATFSAYTGATNDTEYGEDLLLGVLYRQRGEITEPLVVDGGALVAYIANRQPGELSTVEMLRPQMLSMIDQYNAAMFLDAWQEHLLKQGNLTDMAPPVADSEDEVPDEDASGMPAPTIPPDVL